MINKHMINISVRSIMSEALKVAITAAITVIFLLLLAWVNNQYLKPLPYKELSSVELKKQVMKCTNKGKKAVIDHYDDFTPFFVRCE